MFSSSWLGGGPTLAVCLLQFGNIKLLHFEKRFRHLCQLCFILVLKHLVHNRRNNLPRKAELVFKPPALFCLWVRRELHPEVVYFLLGIAVHHERNRLVEGKVVCVSAVHDRKALAFKRNAGMLYGACLVWFFIVAVAKNVANLCIVEY